MGIEQYVAKIMRNAWRAKPSSGLRITHTRGRTPVAVLSERDACTAVYVRTSSVQIEHLLPKRNWLSFSFKGRPWCVSGGALIYIIFSRVQSVGDWLRGSLYILRSLLSRLAWKEPFCVFSFMEIQLVTSPILPHGFPFGSHKMQVLHLWSADLAGGGGWHLLAIFRVTVWGSIFVLHHYFVFPDFLYIFLRETTRITQTPSQLWTNFSYLFFHHFTKDKAPWCQAGKGKKLFHFIEEKSSILQYFSFKSFISFSPAAFISLIHKGTLSWIYKQNPLIKSDCLGDWSRRFSIIRVFFLDIH